MSIRPFKEAYFLFLGEGGRKRIEKAYLAVLGYFKPFWPSWLLRATVLFSKGSKKARNFVIATDKDSPDQEEPGRVRSNYLLSFLFLKASYRAL